MKILSFIHCEALKVLRSSVFWVVVAAFATMPIMLGLVTYINTVDAGWAPYLTDLLGSSTALLVIGYSFTACWVFGREYTDKTISELLVKPVSKLYVVLSKFIVIFLWDVLLALFMFAVVFIMGILIGLNGGTWLLIMNSFLAFIAASLLTMVVSTISALLANISKGYLAPIGLAFLIVVISNVVVQAGLAAYFPWTIPALFISNVPLGFASIAILVITGITGVAGTVAWWRFTEQQ
ncbi:ABC transporter permease [Anaerocolumna sp. MB42-C2]|uniref:ABC transporter permease n=1 Tax=Anaerocolumna sp. MB42-C2 TaxID=3070997 RepID=UPI0027E1BBF9|nr:ABC transporter permease [Anaerocolumna sp. MB42-C2]WMJ88208.1 ABC transporter permease [Anaerocolumna sp. MB42-C2]